MAPAVPACTAEADFMAGLMQGLDASFHPSSSSPTSSPSSGGPSPLIDLADKPTSTPCPTTPKKGGMPNSTPPQATAASAADVDMEELFAGAEDWDLDDYVPSPRKPSPKKPATQRPTHTSRFTPAQAVNSPAAYELDPYTRCVIDSVSEVDLDGQWAKQLDVHVHKDAHDLRTIYLLNDWYDTDARPGDIVNAIGLFEHPPSSVKPCIRITSQSNLLILHPDILLTATALSNAPQCARKPLLSSLVRASSDITPALVWGNMLHEVMQTCLSEKRWEEAWINERIDQVLMNGLGMLLALNVSVETARTELRRRAIGLTIFKDRYIADSPKNEAVLSDTRARAGDKELLLAILQLHEIEEDIWSPKYGLKGKVDAMVEAVISEMAPILSTSNIMNKYLAPSSGKPSLSNPAMKPPTKTTSGPRPFEIKTGRTLAALEHRAQTMLYTLLASERYGTDVPDGLLYYTQSDTVVRVPRSRNEIRGLVVARNQLAGYMIKRIGREGDIRKKRREELEHEDIEEIGMGVEPFLPPPIDSEHACKKCYTLDTCMLYRYAYSSTTPSSRLPALEAPPTGLDAPQSILDAYHLKTGHLTPEQGMFFRKWETLLSLEERDLVRFRRELWTIGAEERERMGRCFAGMVIKPSADREEEKVGLNSPGSTPVGEGKEYKFNYTFARSKSWVGSTQSPTPTYSQADKKNLLNGHLNLGDPVTLSVEPHLLAFAQGYITHLSADEVHLGVDHRVDLEQIRARMRKGRTQAAPSLAHGDDEEEVVFRIDKDELFGGMGRMRNNIAQLFYVNGDKKRLELVVDLRKPVFAPSLSLEDLVSDRETKVYVDHLNESQKGAVCKVLSAEDYALVLGMPGTGKTTVIAALIRILVAQGKTVLLTSYTHSAVDTILRKLDDGDGDGGRGLGFGVLRLGNIEKIHPDVRKYTIGARRKAETVEQLEQQWMGPPVVASTCLSVDHPLFNRRRFDYCIVDEASQITLPTCLGPLRFADKFILVGDHFQLPPLVKNHQARRGGLDVSLFRRLSDAHPDSVIDLREQYRMNEDIMTLSNKLIYSDRLKCGSEEVARRKLVLPNAIVGGGKTWLDVSHRLMGRKRGAKATLCAGVQDKDRCWLSRLTSPDTTAVFVDTDTLGPGTAHDSRVGDLVQNEVEADLVVQLVQALVGRWGVRKKDVGVISLYRQQVKLLKSLLGVEDKRTGEDSEDGEEQVEVLTADKSQGRDKECVIVSMVRSNDEGRVGELVKDWRRMNVSFTRARSKLIIFGSRRTLKADPLLAQFFDLMEARGWVYELPTNAHLVHKDELARGDVEEECSDIEEDFQGTFFEKEDTVVEKEPVEEEMEMTMVQEEEPTEEMEATLVERGPVEELEPAKEKRATTPVKKRRVDDSSDVEIISESIVERKPKKATSRPARSLVIDIDDDDDFMIVDEKLTSVTNTKPKGGWFSKEMGKGKESLSKAASSSKTAPSSFSNGASTSKTSNVKARSVSSGSLKRSHPTSATDSKEKENTKGKGGAGTLDKWFSIGKAVALKEDEEDAPPAKKAKKTSESTKLPPPSSKKGKEKEEPRNRVASLSSSSTKGKARVKETEREKDVRKAAGLLKTRPILQDLVSGEL